jgi:CheY-like chemotaxis protein
MSSESLNGQTILVAEDYDDVRIYVQAYLRRMGANVVGVRNAVEGLETMKNRRITLVLSDILMPGGDGFELVRGIHGLSGNGEKAIPAIAMTGLESLADVKRILSAGFRAYLRKPFTPETLLETIKSVLANREESGTGVSPVDGSM